MTLVFIVDDDDAVRDSLSILLDASGLTVEAFSGGDAVLERCMTKVPDCIVTDVRMPGMGGMELFAALTKSGVDAPVVIMTGHGEVPLAVAAMKAGVADFVEKPFDDDAILGAISGAIKKHNDRLRLRPASAELQARLDSLTSREREVLDLLVAGDANKAIAHALDISIRTVEIHRARVMEKMKAKSLPELVRMALELGTLKIT